VGHRPTFFVACALFPVRRAPIFRGAETEDMAVRETPAETHAPEALTGRLAALIEPTLEDMGFELVRVQLSGGRDPTLQVMAEPADGRVMTVDDCAAISERLSAKLDVEDPIAGGYTLEVSSPGIDRPLTRPKDYERFAGHLARVETRLPVEGRKRFAGPILGLHDGKVRLQVDGVAVDLPFPDIAKAKLVLTDALIAATTPAGGKAN